MCIMKTNYILFFTVVFSFLLSAVSFGSNPEEAFDSKEVQLVWSINDSIHQAGYITQYRPYFHGAAYSEASTILPFYKEQLAVYDDALEAIVQLRELKTEAFDISEFPQLDITLMDTAFRVEAVIAITREQPLLNIHINSIRRIPGSDKAEKLISFERDVFLYETDGLKNDEIQYADNSVLASGNWYKIRVAESGMYKLGYADLQNLGLNPASIDPRHIRIYANGGGILPEANNVSRHDDLVENPIIVVGEEDGVFNQNDYVMFYAEGALTWYFYNPTGYYRHQTNYYDDYSYLFLTVDKGPGKRIETIDTPSATVVTIDDFLDHQLHEQELVNLSNSGRVWYGELFDVNLSRDFNFHFPNLIREKEAWIEVDVAGRNFGTAAFQVFIDGQMHRNLNIEATQQSGGYEYAKPNWAQFAFSPKSDQINVKLNFNRSLNTARGWLNYISINSWRKLKFTGSQLFFSNHRLKEQTVFKYLLADANASVEVYEITEPTNIKRMATSQSGNSLSFNAAADRRRSFIAINRSEELRTPELIGSVANQNLHAIRNIDYLIISHPDFLSEAERLAEYHRNHSNLTVYITTPDKIYNEFSSGSQDITAIRDFNRMLYTTASPGKKLRYLLLFGDASFDYKDKLQNNTNFVPTFQTLSSLDLTYSIATDDYYGFLDQNEGGSTLNLLDIGIGRMPVESLEEAKAMVDKIFSYVETDEKVMGPWRNEVTFLADDGDTNRHLTDAEELSAVIQTSNNEFNITKIYLDAYPQIATPSGQKAPEVNDAINKKMEQGTLIFNYSGHGGEVGLGEERILEIADILSWRNRNKLPIYITATCEFSRYDDPTRRSAGEMVYLHPEGGAIAMFTTARATFSGTNLRLNKAIFQNNMFSKEAGEYVRFGDIIRKSKIKGDDNDRKFVLLGDPALKLAFPKNKVITTHINGKEIGSSMDTLKALDRVIINGFVADANGQKLNGFNGELHITVFDKEVRITTYGDQSSPTSFDTRNSIIYKGLASVTNGVFELQFMMPKDISYRYGLGRISYYATNYEIDAHGAFEDFLIGGYSNTLVDDANGPVIKLYMGDTSFVNGGFTGESPLLLALFSDESGINTTGAGIGHDITATITGASERFAVLNDYYAASLDKSNEGTIIFPFFNLNPGIHTLTLKAWDILNNSATAEITFEVVAGSEMKLDKLFNYPNPMTEGTSFVFSHNQSNEVLDITIDVFDISGNWMHRIQEKNLSSGIRSTPINWNGSLSNGSRLAKGLYIYRLIATNKNGVTAAAYGKLLNYR